MTKRRAPLGHHQAITVIAGFLGWEAAARAIGRKERTLRDLSDPDIVSEISYVDAVALDLAHRAAGGDGSPLLESFQRLVELGDAERVTCERDRAERAATAAEESGEAIAAIIRAGASGRIADRAIARRETEQAIAAFGRTLADHPEPAHG